MELITDKHAKRGVLDNNKTRKKAGKKKTVRNLSYVHTYKLKLSPNFYITRLALQHDRLVFQFSYINKYILKLMENIVLMHLNWYKEKKKKNGTNKLVTQSSLLPCKQKRPTFNCLNTELSIVFLHYIKTHLQQR